MTIISSKNGGTADDVVKALLIAHAKHDGEGIMKILNYTHYLVTAKTNIIDINDEVIEKYEEALKAKNSNSIHEKTEEAVLQLNHNAPEKTTYEIPVVVMSNDEWLNSLEQRLSRSEELKDKLRSDIKTYNYMTASQHEAIDDLFATVDNIKYSDIIKAINKTNKSKELKQTCYVIKNFGYNATCFA